MLSPSLLLPFAVFVILVLTASLYVLAASGHFPRESSRPAMATKGASVTIWLSGLVALLAVAIGVSAACEIVPWYAVVIGAGLAILAAPWSCNSAPMRSSTAGAPLSSFPQGPLSLPLHWV